MNNKKSNQYLELMENFSKLIPKESIQVMTDLQRATEQSNLGNIYREVEMSSKLVASALKSSQSYIYNSYTNVPFEEISEAMITASNFNKNYIQDTLIPSNSIINHLNEIANSINSTFLNNSFLNMTLQLENLYQNINNCSAFLKANQFEQLTTESTNIKNYLSKKNYSELLSTKDIFNTIYFNINIKNIVIEINNEYPSMTQADDIKGYINKISNNTLYIIDSLQPHVDPPTLDNPDQNE